MFSTRGISIHKSLRLTRRNLLAFFFCAFIYFVVYNQRLSFTQLIEESTRNVMIAVEKNTSAVVLPNKITTLVEPSISNSCTDEGREQMLLFMFITSPENQERRDVIRKVYKEGIPEWESTINEHDSSYKVGESIKVLFFVGHSHDESVKERLNKEWELHGDIILDDFEEAYLNLTLKTLRMLKWVNNNCPEVRYLIKIDDDVYLNSPNVLRLLLNLDENKRKNLIAGHRYTEMLIDSDPTSKWYTPTFLWQGPFPDFVAGFFYILGSQSRADLYKFALTTPLFHLEDVYLTGMVRSKYLHTNVTDIPNIYVNWNLKNYFNSSCEIKNITALHPMPSGRIGCWSQFSRKNFSCGHWPTLTYCS